MRVFTVVYEHAVAEVHNVGYPYLQFGTNNTFSEDHVTSVKGLS